MRRLLNLVLVGLMVAGAAYTFEIKRRAEVAAEKVVKLERQITREKETIEGLEASVSVLTQPALLQELTEVHANELQLKPLKVEQVISLEELPNRPIDLSPFQKENQLGGYAGSSDTNIQ